jgi:hypothetical protein
MLQITLKLLFNESINNKIPAIKNLILISSVVNFVVTSCIMNQARDFPGRSSIGTDQWTNQQTNQPTNGPTNGVSYRGACLRLKRPFNNKTSAAKNTIFGPFRFIKPRFPCMENSNMI